MGFARELNPSYARSSRTRIEHHLDAAVLLPAFGVVAAVAGRVGRDRLGPPVTLDRRRTLPNSGSLALREHQLADAQSALGDIAAARDTLALAASHWRTVVARASDSFML